MKKSWHLLRHKGAQEDEVFIGPQSVQIHVTNACALSCHFCPYHFCGDERYGNVRRNISFSVLQNIIDDCEALKVDSVIFSGEGDPFSHPEICSMIPSIVGNVYKECFRDIWSGQRAKQMRFELKYHFDLKKEFFHECRTCPYMSVKAKGEVLGHMEWSKGKAGEIRNETSF